jgi:hypothetical protein
VFAYKKNNYIFSNKMPKKRTVSKLIVHETSETPPVLEYEVVYGGERARDNFALTEARYKRLVSSRSSASEATSVTSTAIVDGTITAVDLADESVTTAKLADVAVTTTKLGDAAVTTAKLDDVAVTTTKLGASAVTTAKLDDAAVTTAKLDDAAVATSKLDDAAVTEAKLSDAAVTTAKLSDDAVTTDKLQDGCVTEAKVAFSLTPSYSSISLNAVSADTDLATIANTSNTHVYVSGTGLRNVRVILSGTLSAGVTRFFYCTNSVAVGSASAVNVIIKLGNERYLIVGQQELVACIMAYDSGWIPAGAGPILAAYDGNSASRTFHLPLSGDFDAVDESNNSTSPSISGNALTLSANQWNTSNRAALIASDSGTYSYSMSQTVIYNGQHSVTAWFKLNSTSANSAAPICRISGLNDDIWIYAISDGTNTTLDFRWSEFAASQTASFNIGTADLNWHFIAIAYDGQLGESDDHVKLSIDGAPLASSSWTAITSTYSLSGASFIFGAGSFITALNTTFGLSASANALLADFRFYDSVAITDDDIQLNLLLEP